MTAGNGKTTTEAELRALIDAQAKAVRAEHIDGSVSRYAANVLLFDLVDPLRSMGSAAARRRLGEWFASFRGPIGYELRDLSIPAGEDVAFCHSLHPVSGTTTDGYELDIWWRATSATASFRAPGWSSTSMPRYP